MGGLVAQEPAKGKAPGTPPPRTPPPPRRSRRAAADAADPPAAAPANPDAATAAKGPTKSPHPGDPGVGADRRLPAAALHLLHGAGDPAVHGAPRQRGRARALVERLEAAIRDKKFQDAYDACKDNDSFLARLVRVGIANLPNGRQEAKETMLEASDEITTSLEMKISYLAIIGTLGPMIGLVGTIAGMIDSFKEIAMAGGSQPRPEKVAMGISMALFITLEGRLAVGPRHLLLRLLPQPDRPDDDGIDARGRPGDQLARRRGQGRQDRLSTSHAAQRPEMTPCPPMFSTELKAEPNLTPLLDVVFQLITFFMLMINFSSDNYDRRITLPVAGSARPVEDEQQRLGGPPGAQHRQQGPPADGRGGPAAAQGRPDDPPPGRADQAEPQGRRHEARRLGRPADDHRAPGR